VSPGAAPGPGTPLAAKLGVRPGRTVALVGAPRGWTVPALPEGAALRRSLGPGADVVVTFVRRAAQLAGAVTAVVAVLGPEDAVWVAWPRRAAGHASDVTDEGVRACGLGAGLVDVKVAALGEDWSGLRFVWPKAARGALAPRRR